MAIKPVGQESCDCKLIITPSILIVKRILNLGFVKISKINSYQGFGTGLPLEDGQCLFLLGRLDPQWYGIP